MTPTLAPVDPEFASIAGALTRRGFLTGAAGAATLLGLAACSSSGGTASSAAAPTTRTVSTAKGNVTVPADPKRIVAIQPSAYVTLADLGVDAAGVYDEGAQYVSPRYRTKWSALPKVGSGGQVDVEKVAALKPDLIIGLDYDWNTSVYSQLTVLAPTVIAATTDWQASVQGVADAVGGTAKLEALKLQLTTRGNAIKTKYAAQLAKYRWDILQGGFDKGQYWLYGPGSDAGQVLAAAGVQFASGSAASPGSANRKLSYEQIDTLASADVIGFYANFDDTPNNEAPALFAQPGFKNLAAAKAGRLVPMPDFLPGGYGDALALLDELEAGLKKLQ